MKKNIGIIGYGNMGSSIAQRLKSKFQVWAFDKDKSKTENIPGIKKAEDTLNLISAVGTVILAVKPQDIDQVLKEIKDGINAKLVISIAAGISTRYIENRLGKPRVIRVMPNLAVRVGKGMICLCKGSYACQKDLDFAKDLFDNLGKTMLVEENLMNAVTAVSGSGPGFFYHLIQDKPTQEWKNYAEAEFMPALAASAQRVGFSPKQAKILAKITTEGSLVLLEKSGIPPGQLCRQVASKGGTTEAGLRVLDGIDSLSDSVLAALKRAEELACS